MDELPPQLQIGLALEIKKNLYSSVKFFSNRDSNFILWIVSVVKPMLFLPNEYVFKKGEQIFEMYFLIEGEAKY